MSLKVVYEVFTLINAFSTTTATTKTYFESVSASARLFLCTVDKKKSVNYLRQTINHAQLACSQPITTIYEDGSVQVCVSRCLLSSRPDLAVWMQKLRTCDSFYLGVDESAKIKIEFRSDMGRLQRGIGGEMQRHREAGAFALCVFRLPAAAFSYFYYQGLLKSSRYQTKRSSDRTSECSAFSH